MWNLVGSPGLAKRSTGQAKHLYMAIKPRVESEQTVRLLGTAITYIDKRLPFEAELEKAQFRNVLRHKTSKTSYH